MNLNLIKMYINKIKKNDVESFLNNNEINVNENELDYLYDILKNKYTNVLDEDQETFDDIKKNISSSNFDKLIKLYNKYKDLHLR